MISLFQRAPAARARRGGRVLLRLQSLEGRATPSTDLLPIVGPMPDAQTTTSPVPVAQDGQTSTANQPPEIVDFTVDSIGGGWFCVSGQVLDEHPGGLTVTFGGNVATMSGESVTTNTNGYFSVMVFLNCNGSDTGWLTAVTKDGQGLSSELASVYCDP